MGNSQVRSLKAAVLADNMEQLRNLVADDQSRFGGSLLWQPVNKKGDSPLSYAVRQDRMSAVRTLIDMGSGVNCINKEGETALDISLNRELPGDGDILHHHFCPYFYWHAPEEHQTQIPEMAKILLRAGAEGKSIERFILHAMKNPGSIKELIDLISDLKSPRMYRISGLLLQVAVWFKQDHNLESLFTAGIDLEKFWTVPFMPEVVPNNSHNDYSRTLQEWPQEQAGEYQVEAPVNGDAIQSLKLSFVQDWRADWNDGENPEAQYRAGLHITPECAIEFIRAANSYRILVMIVSDVISYLPATCSGPELKETHLIGCLMMADYVFSEQEMQHLRLKFSIDFGQYLNFHSQPKMLKHICRLNIRQNMRENVFYSLKRLGFLPKGIKEYISLKTDLPNDATILRS